MKESLNGSLTESAADKEQKHKSKKTYSIELPLKKDIIGLIIKGFRKMRNLSQEKLGELVGVQKSQISKLEKSDKNVTLGTMLKVFKALSAKINLKIEIDKKSDMEIIKQVLSEDKVGTPAA